MPADLLLLMPPWKHIAREKFPEFTRVRVPLLDVLQQYYPWRQFYREQIASGEIPLWNPYMFCGTPFVANGLSGVFYPFNLFFLILPLDKAFGWFAWFHLSMAGVFMYLFLRNITFSLAALMGAVSFQFSGFLIAWLAYIPVVASAIWLPAALWGLSLIFKKDDTQEFSDRDCQWNKKVIGFVIASLAVGLSLLGGHPQMAFYVTWAIGCYGLVGSILLKHWSPLLMAFGVLILGFLLGSAQVLPLLEFGRLSSRAVATEIIPVGTNLPIDQWVRLFFPKIFGTWADGTHWSPVTEFSFVEKTGYPGMVAWLFLAIAISHLSILKKVYNTVHQLSVLGIVYVAIGLLAATFPAVHRAIGFGLPGTASFVGFSRALLLFNAGVALLSAAGFETLFGSFLHKVLRQKGLGQGTNRFFYLSLVVLFLTVALLTSVFAIVHREAAFHPLLLPNTLQSLINGLVIGGLTSGLIIWAKYKRASSGNGGLTLLQVLTIAICAADLLAVSWSQHPQASREALFFRTPALNWLTEHQGLWRVVAAGTDPIRGWTPSNTLTVYKLRDIQGSDSLVLGRYQSFLKTWDERAPGFSVRSFDSPLLDMMSVRYILTPNRLKEAEKASLRAVYKGEIWIYENRTALPRAWFAREVATVSDPKEALKGMVTAGKKSTNKVFLENSHLSKSSFGSKASVRIIADQPNVLTLAVHLDNDAVLFVADTYYPGWRVYSKIRDQWMSVPHKVANYTFRAALIPSDSARVTWVFYPDTIIIGLFCTIVSVGAMGCGIAFMLTCFSRGAQYEVGR
ncbi:MAG: YfhO family protein [Armatimonadetes bacterium]|nr:YfhO family protein [Armatimonadota bacterium]MDW8120774.1 YfhO family protein [Armatimonadota bacterium]